MCLGISYPRTMSQTYLLVLIPQNYCLIHILCYQNIQISIAIGSWLCIMIFNRPCLKLASYYWTMTITLGCCADSQMTRILKWRVCHLFFCSIVWDYGDQRQFLITTAIDIGPPKSTEINDAFSRKYPALFPSHFFLSLRDDEHYEVYINLIWLKWIFTPSHNVRCIRTKLFELK
jgi:hypothetical protein